MKCSEYQELISIYVDGELSPHEEQEIISHLEGCSCCKQTYDALVQIVEACNQMEEVELPDHFHQTLMRQVESTKMETDVIWGKRRWKWQYSGALVATLLVGGVWMHQLNGIIPENTAQNNVETCEISESESASLMIAQATEDMGDRSGRMAVAEKNIEDNLYSEVYVRNQEEFEMGLETILEQQKIQYEKDNMGYYNIKLENAKFLIEWIEQNSQSVNWYQEDIESVENIDLRLKISEQP